MAATGVNATMWQGETRRLVFTLTGTINLSAGGSTAIAWKLSATADTTALLSKAVGTGITIDSATQFTVALAPADTADLSGPYYHEARVTNSTGDQGVVAVGTLTVTASNTG